MVVKCVTILRYKLTTVVVIACVLIFPLYSILKVCYKLLTPAETTCFFSEPVDVVYTWVNGSDPRFLQSLHDYLQINSTAAQDYSNQRFDDKYELKFSLRSLEKYAPWIRHVYIVTSGQIPCWLDLDYEKVTLVSHEDIFTDKLDLPTFSSPAIESHLHRIPGLSRRFIYFNDDVFLGAPMFMDDFLSPSRGFLVYLAWPLPMCAVGCPWVYVSDGQCDAACYNVHCQMDGEDCAGLNQVHNSWEKYFVQRPRPKEGTVNDFQDGNAALNLPHYQTNSSQKEQNHLNDVKYYVLNSTTDLTNKISQRYSNSSVTKSSETYQNNHLNNSQLALRNKRARYEHPLPLINSKIILEREPVVNSKPSFLHSTNATNLTTLVEQHNRNVMLHNKLRRRKRMARRNLNDVSSAVHLSNATPAGRAKRASSSIDAYGASLQHTNRIYNLRYGFKSRYVPAHCPIMLDKDIVESLQETFTKEFAKTSSNHLRSEDDMQFAFSYYHFLINEKKQLSVAQIFDFFDTDTSGTWSDREIRSLLTKMYDLPLSYATVDHFEDVLLNCSKQRKFPQMSTPEFERYIDSKLPTVSKELVVNCPVLSSVLLDNFSMQNMYKYEVINNAQSSHVTFKMLSSNISEVVGYLDEIRRNTKKFVCLNDNMDDSKVSENELIRAVLYDFYLSLFPKPSKFELSTDFRNRFLYIEELNQWKSYHFKLRMCTYVCIFILCYVTYCNLFKRRFLGRFINKLFC